MHTHTSLQTYVAAAFLTVMFTGKLKPNLGRFDAAPEWVDILKHFRGSELQNYFAKVWIGLLSPLLRPHSGVFICLLLL
jgi:translation initiation factor RLI1